MALGRSRPEADAGDAAVRPLIPQSVGVETDSIRRSPLQRITAPSPRLSLSEDPEDR